MTGSVWERIINPISTRRDRAPVGRRPASMDEQKVDVLVMQNSNQFSGGYVRWFAGSPPGHGTATSVIFPKDDDMTIVTPGAFAIDRTLKPGEDIMRRGVKRWIASPTFMGAHFTGLNIRDYARSIRLTRYGEEQSRLIEE